MKIKKYFLISIFLTICLISKIYTNTDEENIRRNTIINGCNNLIMSRMTYDQVKNIYLS